MQSGIVFFIVEKYVSGTKQASNANTPVTKNVLFKNHVYIYSAWSDNRLRHSLRWIQVGLSQLTIMTAVPIRSRYNPLKRIRLMEMNQVYNRGTERRYLSIDFYKL